MLIAFLGFECYHSNSTFVYNPILRQGVLRASFIAISDKQKYDICQQLSGHLVRAKVNFIPEYLQDQGEISAAARFAESSTFFFELGSAISLTLTAESQADHVAALATELANFEIQAMDMDAAISQTLGEYSVNDFHYNECFQNMKTFTYDRKLRIIVDINDCDVSLTRFNFYFSKNQVKDDMVRASVTVSTYGTISIEAGIAVYENYAGITENLEIEFNCDEIRLQSRADESRCLRIVNFLAKHTDFDCTFKLHFSLMNSTFSEQFWAYSSSITNARYPNCISSSYILNVDFLMINYQLSDLPECSTELSDGYYFEGTMQDVALYTSGQRFFFNESIVIREGQREVSIECDLMTDGDSCRETLRYFTLRDSQILKFRVFYRFSDGSEQFMTSQSVRKDYCFLNIMGYLELDELSTEGGAVRVEILWTGSDKCSFEESVRSQLSFRLVKLSKPNGRYAQSEDDPLLEMSLLDGFSVQNSTMQFVCSGCKSALKTAATLLRNRQLFAYFVIDSAEIPVNSLYDNIVDVNVGMFAGVAIALGVVFGVGGAFANVEFREKRRKRSRAVI